MANRWRPIARAEPLDEDGGMNRRDMDADLSSLTLSGLV